MTWRFGRIVAGIVCGALVGLPGCAVAVDVLNPGLVSALGIDPETVFPSHGTVIVAFTNGTDSPAVFHAFQSVGGLDYTIDSRNFSVEVPAATSRNEVLTCPIGLISPGSLGADFGVEALAAEVVTTGGVVDVEYVWPMQEGQEFNCGDVILVQLTSATVVTGGGTGQATTAYVITVRVIPGS